MTSNKTTQIGRAELGTKHINGCLDSLPTERSSVWGRMFKTRLVTCWITTQLGY